MDLLRNKDRFRVRDKDWYRICCVDVVPGARVLYSFTKYNKKPFLNYYRHIELAHSEDTRSIRPCDTFLYWI